MLEDIDPNPENFVCAGIVHTTSGQIGCLIRLEPNKQANVSPASIDCSPSSTKRVLVADVSSNGPGVQGDRLWSPL